MPHKHEPNRAAGISRKVARELDRAMQEMDSEEGIDDTASTHLHQSDIGRGVFSRMEGGSTTPKIVRHDRVWESLRNQHPQLESDEVEELLTHVLSGKSPGAASRDDFESFDPDKFVEVMNMSEEEVEELLDEEDSDE